jgi:hypothetical protein
LYSAATFSQASSVNAVPASSAARVLFVAISASLSPGR